MNRKPVQIIVMILIAIMFAATIIISAVWKPVHHTAAAQSPPLLQVSQTAGAAQNAAPF